MQKSKPQPKLEKKPSTKPQTNQTENLKQTKIPETLKTHQAQNKSNISLTHINIYAL